MKFLLTATPMDAEAQQSMTKEREYKFVCDGFCMIGITKMGDRVKSDVAIHQVSIDTLSEAIYSNNKLCASARLGVAKHDARIDAKQNSVGEMIEKLMEALQ